MLLDPSVINHGQTLTTSAGVASNFRRTKIGSYSSTDGAFSTDQPARLTITPNWRASGPSIYKGTFEVDKNVAPVNGVQQADDTLRVTISISGNLRSFGVLDFVAALSSLSYFMMQNMQRILSGES